MISRLELWHYKAFRKFALPIDSRTVVVGANAAGKSTAIEALRVASEMLSHALRRGATSNREIAGEVLSVYPFESEQFSVHDENLRHEFRDVESGFRVTFDNGASLTAVWPREEDEWPYFYLRTRDGIEVASPSGVRWTFSQVGVIPPLAPVEPHEDALTPRYVQRNRSGRLSSRHFRNQLRYLDERDWGFYEFASRWLPEIAVDQPVVQIQGRESSVDVFYREGTGVSKELVWAGAGIQVFLQLLLHIFRLRAADTIIVDEPEVYLHPDLQSRLLKVLEATFAQTIIATHSAEIAIQSPEATVIVDKSRSSAIRAKNPALLAEASRAMGTSFNLSLARTLKSKLTLFVEGGDAKVLQTLALTLGAERIALERDVSVVPLGGLSNYTKLTSFEYLVDSLLGGSLRGYVILDGDFRGADWNSRIVAELRRMGLECHVWRHNELESYLMHAQPIARLSGISSDLIEASIAEEAQGMHDLVLRRMISERVRDPANKGRDVSSITEGCQDELAELWGQEANRPGICPAKELLSKLNAIIQAQKGRAVSAVQISRAMLSDEIPGEVETVLRRIEELAAGA